MRITIEPVENSEQSFNVLMEVNGKTHKFEYWSSAGWDFSDPLSLGNAIHMALENVTSYGSKPVTPIFRVS